MSLPGRVSVALVAALVWSTTRSGDAADEPNAPAEVSPAPTSAVDPSSSTILRSLQRRTRIDADGVPRSALIARLAADSGVRVVIDAAALDAGKIPLDSPVTVHLADITLKSALNLILEPVHAKAIIRDEALTVTSAAVAADLLETRLYDVRRVAKGEFKELIDVLRWCVVPHSWDEFGGPGSVTPVAVAGALSIRQTQSIHDLLARLLADLDRGLSAGPNDPLPAPSPDTIRDAEQALLVRLAARCDFECRQEPLGESLKRLAVENKLPLWLDPALTEEEAASLESAVTLALPGVRVESVLNHLLGPRQLAWIIEDEVLKVTTSAKAEDTLVTRVYDARDFAGRAARVWTGGRIMGIGGWVPKGGFIPFSPPKKMEDSGLVDAIETVIAPDAWDSNGGPGSAVYYRGLLVVNQTQVVHKEITLLLRPLRAMVLRKRAEEPPAADEVPPRLKLVVYDLTDCHPPASDVVKMIPEVVSPQSWKGAGGRGAIHAGPLSLAVLQTPEVHDQIVDLLYKVLQQDFRKFNKP